MRSDSFLPVLLPLLHPESWQATLCLWRNHHSTARQEKVLGAPWCRQLQLPLPSASVQGSPPGQWWIRLGRHKTSTQTLGPCLRQPPSAAFGTLTLLQQQPKGLGRTTGLGHVALNWLGIKVSV